MWLVLCERWDLPALWAARRLAASGLRPMHWVSSDALAGAPWWEHRLEPEADGTAIHLADGRVLRAAQVHGTLNRLAALAPQQLRRLAPADRDYASQEMAALLTSFLEQLPGPVLNRPADQGIAGPMLHLSEWLVLAARAGLPTPPYVHATDTPREMDAYEVAAPRRGLGGTLIVVGDGVAGPAGAPEPIVEGARRLAELVHAELLGIRFGPGAGGAWTFAGASPVPDLTVGGNALVTLLERRLAA